jgi:hypothetical protein
MPNSADQAAQAVIGGGAFFDEALPGAVQAQDDLLVFFLDRDEAHVRPGDGFADGGGVRRVVLAALAAHAVGRDELGRHQLDGVAVLAEQPRPVVRAGAGFHADEAGRQLRHQLQQFVACYLGLDQCGLAVIINAMHGKDVLGQIDSNGDNAHGLPLSWF